MRTADWIREELPDVVFGKAIHPGRGSGWIVAKLPDPYPMTVMPLPHIGQLGSSLYSEWPWWRKAWHFVATGS